MLTIEDVRKRLKVAASTVYQLCKEGRMPHHRIGSGRGTIRISEPDLHQFMEDCRSTPRLPTGLKHLRSPD